MGALATFGHNVVNLFRATPRTDRASLFSEKAVDQFLNILTSPADPDEVLRRSNIARWNLRALTGDDEITTAMDTRREALLAVPWRLEPVGIAEDGATFPEPVQWVWDQFEPLRRGRAARVHGSASLRLQRAGSGLPATPTTAGAHHMEADHREALRMVHPAP
jgi:hypothetical protein